MTTTTAAANNPTLPAPLNQNHPKTQADWQQILNQLQSWQNVLGIIVPPMQQTAAEIAAGVTPTNYAYAPMDIRRYGPVDITGTNDSSTAINNAITVNAGPVLFPSGNIRWDTPPTLGFQTSIILQGQGADQTTLWVKNQTGYTFTLSNSNSCLTWKAVGLTVDGSNGNQITTGSYSTTWLGFFLSTRNAGLSVAYVYTEDLVLGYTAATNAALLNYGTAIFVDSYRTRFWQCVNGYGYIAGGTGVVTTTVSLRKCYIHGCRQAYAITAAVSDVTHTETVLESCCAGGISTLCKVVWDNCYFENIGSDPLGLSRKGISAMDGGLIFGNALDTSNIDCCFTQVYGEQSFKDCRFARLATGGTASAWYQAIGIGSTFGADGSLYLIGGTNGETTGTFFRGEVVVGERANFAFHVNDQTPNIPTTTDTGVINFLTDARLIKSGWWTVVMNDNSRHLAEVKGGLFRVLPGPNGYTAVPGTYPSSAGWAVGDRVEIASANQVAGAELAWICTVAGTTSAQWDTADFVPISTSASVAAAGTKTFGGPISGTGTTVIWEVVGTLNNTTISCVYRVVITNLNSAVAAQIIKDADSGTTAIALTTASNPYVVTITNNNGTAAIYYVRLLSIFRTHA